MPEQDQPKIAKFGEGKYILTTRLGSGGFAEVYKGQDTESGLEVAIKVLKRDLGSDEGMVKRFQREAESMEHMNHPNVLKVLRHGFDPQRRRHFYVMELIKGMQDPEKVICPKFPLENKIEIILQAINGFQYIHNLGLVHRDGKPDNIIVHFLDPTLVREVEGQILTDRKNIRARVSDLGIVKNLADDTLAKLTQTGTAMGTPYYMSPEQAEGKEIDHRSDIYSLGATLYHYATGMPPYNELNNANQIMAAKLRKKPPRDPREIDPEIPLPLAKIIRKAMASLSFQRYQTMSEFGEDLLRYSEGESPEKLKTSFYGRAPRRTVVRGHRSTNHKPKSKNLLWTGIGGAIAAAVLGGAVLLFGGKKTTPPTKLPEPPKNHVVEPVVREPTPLEQYREFAPTAVTLEEDINQFLTNGSTDLDSLNSLQNKLNEVYPQVTGFQGRGVAKAKVMSERLFSHIEGLAARKSLIRDYQRTEEKAKGLVDGLDRYVAAGDLKEKDLKRFAADLTEAEKELNRYREKGLAVSGLGQGLTTHTDKVSKLIEELKRQEAARLAAQPKVDPVEEAYLKFVKNTRRGLGGDIGDYVEEASYDAKKLDELLGKVKEAQTELGKYEGREGAKDLEKLLNGQETELSQIQKFVKSSQGKNLLSQISAYENYLEKFFENPDDKKRGSNIRRAGFFIRGLMRYGKVTEPLVERLKGHIARLKGEKGEEKPVERVVVAIPNNPILYMPFNKNTIVRQGDKLIVKDLSGNKSHGVIYGARQVKGKFGEALEFDGNDDYVSLGKPDSLNFIGRVDFTISAWIYCKGGTRFRPIVSKGDQQYKIEWDVNNDNKIEFSIYDKDHHKSFSDALNSNQWYHIVGRVNDSKIEQFIDGVKQSNTSTHSGIANTNYDVEIGRNPRFPTGRLFSGIIDEIIIYNRALSEKEIKFLHSQKPRR